MNNIYMPEKVKIKKIIQMQEIEWLFTVEYDGETLPGQFMQISLPKIGECPISITKHNKEKKQLEFLIRQVGRVTDEIFKLKVGDHLFIRGPFGNSFDFDSFRDKNLIVISGGSGLAPVRPIFTEFYDDENFKLLAGFKNKDQILFEHELSRCYETNKNIYVTLDDNSDNDPRFLSGMVTKHIELLLYGLDPKETVVVVVGPPIMMHFVTLELKKYNIEDENIIVSFERNMSCAVGKCGHCKIDETYICLEGPVFNYAQSKNLLD